MAAPTIAHFYDASASPHNLGGTTTAGNGLILVIQAGTSVGPAEPSAPWVDTGDLTPVIDTFTKLTAADSNDNAEIWYVLSGAGGATHYHSVSGQLEGIFIYEVNGPIVVDSGGFVDWGGASPNALSTNHTNMPGPVLHTTHDCLVIGKGTGNAGGQGINSPWVVDVGGSGIGHTSGPPGTYQPSFARAFNSDNWCMIAAAFYSPATVNITRSLTGLHITLAEHAPSAIVGTITGGGGGGGTTTFGPLVPDTSGNWFNPIPVVADFFKYLYDQPVKTDRDGDSVIFDFSLVKIDANFVRLSRGNYIRITTQTYPIWFTGYITYESEYLPLGKDNDAEAHWGYKYQASSDEIILSHNQLGIIPPFLNKTQGEILIALAELKQPGLFNYSNVQDGLTLARYVVDPTKKFSDVAKEFAQAAVYRLWAQDHKLYFQPKGSFPNCLIIDGNDIRFTPANLTCKGSTSLPIINDAVVVGNVEAQRYTKEYFVGDGSTGSFPLSASVYGVESVVLLDDDFSSSSFDSSKWVLFDQPTGFIRIFDGYVNVIGGDATMSDVHLDSAQLIALGGNLRIAHGDYDFVPQTADNITCGVIGGLWTQDPNSALTGCIYGILVTKASGVVTLKPIINGVVDSTQSQVVQANATFGNPPAFDITLSYTVGQTVTYLGQFWECISNTAPGNLPTDPTFWAAATSKRYVLRTIFSTQQVFRASQEYNYLDVNGLLQTYGGGISTADIVIQTYITELDPNTGLVTGGYPHTWLNAISATVDQGYATYVAAASIDLHVTFTGITISTPMQARLSIQAHNEGVAGGFVDKLVGPNEIDATDGLAPYATIAQSGGVNQKQNILGSPLYHFGDPTLQFFKNTAALTTTVPQIYDIVRLAYRSAGSSIGRSRDEASVDVEADNWYDSGVRSIVRNGDVTPIPQTSLDCEAAASAIVAQNAFTHYDGVYKIISDNLIDATVTPVWNPSTSYAVNAVVSYFGFNWICITPTTSGIAPGNRLYWATTAVPKVEPRAGGILPFQNLPTDAFPVTGFTEPIYEVVSTMLTGRPEHFNHDINYGLKTDSEALLKRLAKFQKQTDVFTITDSTEIPKFIPVTSVGLAYTDDVTNAAVDYTNGGTIPRWSPSTAYTIPQLILDADNNIQLLVVAGTSGGTEPTNWFTHGIYNQLGDTATITNIDVNVSTKIVTVTCLASLDDVMTLNSVVRLSGMTTKTWLEGAQGVITSITTTLVTHDTFSFLYTGLANTGTISGSDPITTLGAPSFGPKGAGTISIETLDTRWSLIPSGVLLEDGVASASYMPNVHTQTDRIVFNNFNLNASGVSVTGIQVDIKQRLSYADGSGAPGAAQIHCSLRGGGGGSVVKSITPTLTAGLNYITFGGPTDLWNTTWSIAEINAAIFGPTMTAFSLYSKVFVNIDYVRVTVFVVPTVVTGTVGPTTGSALDTGTATIVGIDPTYPRLTDGSAQWAFKGHATGADVNNFYYNIGQNPPQNNGQLGGFEVRYTDASWGCDSGKNLAVRTPSPFFGLARSRRNSTIFIKAYDIRNYLFNSEDFTSQNGNGAWVATGCTVAYTNSADPDGNLATLSLVNVTASGQTLSQATPDSLPVGDMVFSIDLRGVTGKQVSLTISAAGGGSASTTVTFDGAWDRIHVPLLASGGGIVTVTITSVTSVDQFLVTRASLEVGTSIETVYAKTTAAGA